MKAEFVNGKTVLFYFDKENKKLEIPFEKLDNFHQAVLGEIKRRSENGMKMSESVRLKKV